MNLTYSDWIDRNVVETYGTCEEVTQEMAKEFPELTRVRGHYYCLVWGEREHWWLVDPNVDIIDPTASQFPSKGTGHYEPWDDTLPEPTGKCPQCGELIYDEGYTHKECAEEYAAYCTNPY